MTEALGKNEILTELAGTVAAAVNDYNGDPVMQRQLLKQVDNLRLLLEAPMDPIFKQWEMVRFYISPTKVLFNRVQLDTNHRQMVTVSAINLLVESGALDEMPREGSITSKDLAALVEVEESAISTSFYLKLLNFPISTNTLAQIERSRWWYFKAFAKKQHQTHTPIIPSPSPTLNLAHEISQGSRMSESTY